MGGAMTENTLHWLAVAAIVVAATAVIYMWMQQSQPFATPSTAPFAATLQHES